MMKLNGNHHTGSHSPSPSERDAGRGPKKRSKAGKAAAVVVCVVLILVFGAVAWYIAWEKPPERPGGGLVDPTYESTNPQDGGSPDATAEPTVSPAEDPNAGAPASLNENMYTFLVVGLDQVSNSTDTMMVGRIDTENHTIDVVSLPRDTLVNVSWSVKKINTLYSADINTGGNGIDGLLDGLKDILGFRIDCYAVVDLTAFVELVDAIGGVDYNVPVNMNYYDPTQDLYINIPAGEQHLDGEEALKVVRFRSGYASADIGRIGTQQDFLKSVASQMLTLGNIPNLPTFIDIFEEYVVTNMSASNLAFFARQFLLCKSEDINFHTLPGNYGDSIKGLSYVSINISEWLEMVNTYLNPYDQDVTEANVNILTHSSSTGFYSTTGYVAGGVDSFYDNTAAFSSADGTDSAE
ncbi:MAG TPA: LCP family protein [Candidatus Scatomorpha pullistercoris]|uniref:LCP family protein n=1 Tax=Candidatus Scatomorpha pullistercoris TaxID=2840929 RepID=A0A9D1G4S8_9FIRM|nr:LCP family protein [Candidatus Scatomorpha pullistercoris]